jgi:hypothetical protein
MQLITNPSQSILPNIAESVTSILVEGVWRLQQIAGDELRLLSDDAHPSDATVADSSIRFRRMSEGMQKYIDPPIIQVAVEKIDPTAGRRPVSTSALMFPCMTFMSVLFMAGGIAGDIWKEKISGTIRHVITTSSPLSGFWGGKVLALATVFASLGIVALIAGKALIRAEIHNAVYAVLWIAVFGSAMYMAFVLMHTVFANPRGATMLSNILIMSLGMVGGSFFPFEIMPEFLARIGRHLPNGWAIIQFNEILSGRIRPIQLMMDFSLMLVIAALLFILVVRRMRRNFIF